MGPDGGTHQASTWTLLAINRDRGLLDIRFSQGNSGMVAGQGHARADWVSVRDGAVRYTRDALAGDITETEKGIWIGPDTLHQEEDAWALELRSGQMDARIQFKNDLVMLPQSTEADWTVQALFAGPMAGVLRAGGQSAILDGYAVGIHRFGADPPGLRGSTRRSAFVLDKDLAIGIDQSGGQSIAFVRVGGKTFDASTAVLSKSVDGWLMDFRPAIDMEVKLRPHRPHLQTDPWEHLYRFEHWIAGMRFGRPVRRLRAAEAQIRMGERQLTARGLISVSDFK
jgi:hypothetical protein